ncbi:undecaprenyl-phosphate glucose phosphotransferase [Aeromonas media]|uniref:undecaprenyl-phosphate glucose phosphotransferase n=1 Tax=Aeromonas media TaxID=651 RepID=UPI00111954B5|nr:undecaprenyl-phosphate glucose phosphotransferase [Aeromonas media]
MHQLKRGVLHANASVVTLIQRISDALLIGMLLGIIGLLRQQSWTLQHWVVMLGMLVLFQFCAELAHLYRSWCGARVLTEIGYATGVWCVTFGCLVMFTHLLPSFPLLDNNTLWQWFTGVFVSFAVYRFLLRHLLHSIRRHGYNSRTAAIVGAGYLGQHLAQQLLRASWLGIRVAGFYDDHKSGNIALEEAVVPGQALPVLGELEQLVIDAKGGAIDRIYITLPMRYEKRIHELVTALSDTTCSVLLVPDIFTFNLLHSRASALNGIPLISIFDTPMLGVSALIKRAEDIVLASLILLLISPVLLALALAVKLTSKGPVIFKQRRYGIDGKPIEVWKFRSMTVTEDGDQVTQATKGDSRLTPIGAFIRGTSLDELPQFINVLKGDMSIVGPRPHAIVHNEQYRKLILGYMLRHKVKPGITGWAQINGWRGETDTLDKMEKRIEYDLEYIRAWSLWLDLKIVFFTVFKGFVSRNAY